MKRVTIIEGWWIFFTALWRTRFWSVGEAAEWMFQLNAFARGKGRHSIVDQIYDLKNALIKYLYQHGYAYEVKMHKQIRTCNACDGSGVHWSGEDCWKCDGTGVYSVTKLYAFRFEIRGRRFAWHQLEKLVDYSVTLTDLSEPTQFQGAEGRGELESLHQAWLGCCVVWWFLLTRGVIANLMLFAAIRGWWYWNVREPIWKMFRTRRPPRMSAIKPSNTVAEDDIPF